MPITGPEPVIAAVVTRLTDELAPFIDGVNAEADDGIVCEQPVAIFDFVPPRSMITDTPLLAVMEGPFTLEDDTGWGATGNCHITVVNYLTDYDPRHLAMKLRRMDRAIIECVLKGRSIPPAWGVTFVRSDPGPTLSRKESPREMFSLRASTFDVRFEQDTP